jgi:hypothetical protein
LNFRFYGVLRSSARMGGEEIRAFLYSPDGAVSATRTISLPWHHGAVSRACGSADSLTKTTSRPHPAFRHRNLTGPYSPGVPYSSEGKSSPARTPATTASIRDTAPILL